MKHPVDTHVGKAVRHRRWTLGMTQQKLAEHLGVKFQQVQKYETGINRVSASRLWDMSIALGVPVSFFFEGYEDDTPETSESLPDRLMADHEALNLIRAYFEVPEDQRRRLSELAKRLRSAA